jgi:hypothetical protein
VGRSEDGWVRLIPASQNQRCPFVFNSRFVVISGVVDNVSVKTPFRDTLLETCSDLSYLLVQSNHLCGTLRTTRCAVFSGLKTKFLI